MLADMETSHATKIGFIIEFLVAMIREFRNVFDPSKITTIAVDMAKPIFAPHSVFT
jgi:hypothetical protein